MEAGRPCLVLDDDSELEVLVARSQSLLAVGERPGTYN